MRTFFYIIFAAIILSSCNCNNEKELVGTWKLIYGEIKEGDSVEIKDLSNTDFIKIINEDHFAFLNQRKGTSEGFYGGGGTYTLVNDKYIETLDYIDVDHLRGHEFSFTIEIKGDTLIQYGKEEVKEANIDRDIIEKYIRIK
jgi:hypothetical protein